MSEVSNEAVEAAALRMCRIPRWPASWDEGARDYWRDLARDALSSRVSPSAEEVHRLVGQELAERVPDDAMADDAFDALGDAITAAVLALYASQPTVDEVLEPVQALVDGRSDIGQPFRPPNMTTRAIHRGDVAAALERARTVARTETKFPPPPRARPRRRSSPRAHAAVTVRATT